MGLEVYIDDDNHRISIDSSHFVYLVSGLLEYNNSHIDKERLLDDKYLRASPSFYICRIDAIRRLVNYSSAFCCGIKYRSALVLFFALRS